MAKQDSQLSETPALLPLKQLPDRASDTHNIMHSYNRHTPPGLTLKAYFNIIWGLDDEIVRIGAGDAWYKYPQEGGRETSHKW